MSEPLVAPLTTAGILEEKISTRRARVGIVGLGYVGLPLAVEFARAGFSVTGIDVSAAKIGRVNAGDSYVGDVPSAILAPLVEAGKLRATTDFAAVSDLDTINICVPTPLRKTKDPDMSFIVSACQEVAEHFHAGMLVILESTTYPGTTDELVLPMLSKSGLQVGDDFFLCFSPERVDPGNPKFQTKNIPKVVGGVTKACTDLGALFYSQALEHVVPVSSTRAAEMTKLLENIFRCVNIALVNELKLLCLRMGVDVWEVIDAASTKPFGFMPFYPGPGLGGHCIPVDPFYLSWKAREYDFSTRFIELAGEINTSMPYHVVDSVTEALNMHKKSLSGSRILVLGVAYKKDVDDLRESPTLKIMEILKKRGANFDYNDPFFPQLHKMRHYDYSNMKSVPLNADTLGKYDAVLIATDHSSYDYGAIVDASKLVIDTRNATRRVIRHRAKIVLC